MRNLHREMHSQGADFNFYYLYVQIDLLAICGKLLIELVSFSMIHFFL